MAKSRSGFFISFEGADGAGKSSQIRRLADALKARGNNVLATREPGGSPGGELIRKLLVEGPAERWTPLSEALLMYAARADHLDRVIRPALDRGEIVITDRFADSTLAYQGFAGGLGAENAEVLRNLVVGEDDPDLTLILDISTEAGLARAGQRGGVDTRFESKGTAYQESVRQAFLSIASANPDRCRVIDASNDEASVFAEVFSVVEERLKARYGR